MTPHCPSTSYFSPTPHDREDLHLLKRRRGAWLGGWGGGGGAWLISTFEQNAATRWNGKMYLWTNSERHDIWLHWKISLSDSQGCISCGMCSYPELTKDHVLTSAYVNIFRTVTRNAVNKSVWRKKDCFWLPLNKHAMNIWLSSLRIRAHLSWRTGKHLHVLHVLRTYSTCSHPGW